MAVEFNVPHTRSSEIHLAPEDIVLEHDMNGRHDLPDISEMVDSLLEYGQLQPVTIRKMAGKPVLVAGFTRFRAVAHINANNLSPKPLRLRCSYTALSEQQAFLANIQENRVRNATTPMDDAYNIQRLINVYQMSEDEVCKAFHCGLPWVKDRLSLIELVPEAQEAVKSGRVKVSAAKAIAKLSKDLQKKAVAGTGKVTVASVKPATAPVSPAPSVDLKVAAKKLFQGWTKAEYEELEFGDGQWMSVDRAKLLELFQAVQ